MVRVGIGKATLAALIISEIKRGSTVGQINLTDLAQLMDITPQSATKKIENLRLKNGASEI